MQPPGRQRRQPRYGLLGGSFDPVHAAHVELALRARDALGLDRVFLVPAGRAPHKRRAPVASARHRLAMLRLAVRGKVGLEPLDIELRRGGPSYTVETLEELHRRRPGRYFLVLGSDLVAYLASWRRPRRVRELATPAVAVRPGHLRGLPRRARRILMPRMEVSSREIRRRVRRGLPISQWVPAAVGRYIRRHGLYRR